MSTKMIKVHVATEEKTVKNNLTTINPFSHINLKKKVKIFPLLDLIRPCSNNRADMFVTIGQLLGLKIHNETYVGIW